MTAARHRRGGGFAVLICLGLIGAFESVAAGRPHVGLRVKVDPIARVATGRVRIRIANPTEAPLDHIELWRFPARLGQRSKALTEQNFYWVYPYQFNPGAMAVSDVSVDGKTVSPTFRDHAEAGPGTLIDVPLPSPLSPGAEATVEATFATRVPRRYGTFGCYDGGCTLSGGFYPMPVQLNPLGFDESAPPMRADYDIAVEFDPARDLPECLIDGAPGTVAHLDNAAWAGVLVAPHFAERSTQYKNVRIAFRHRGRALTDPLEGDRAKRVLEDAKSAIDLLGELELPVPEGAEVRLVEVPLRTELADPQAGLILVSDQLYKLFPLNRFRKFHSFQLIRAVFASLAERALARNERAADLGWSPDVVASWLLDLFTLRTYRQKEFAKDILRWVSFIPAIDRILYAPQIPFAAAYFNTLEDPSPARDDLRRFSNLRPRGKVVYEKLRDLLGDEATQRAMRMMWHGAPVHEAAETAYGKPHLDWFFAQWLRPYPGVNYRFEVLGSERTERGQKTRIRVFKEGKSPPMEPVEIRVTEWGGTRHELVWDGHGTETVLTVETTRSIREMLLDPRGRLTENLAGNNNDLRVDNRQPGEVRFVYNNFGALFNFSTLNFDLSVDFSFSRMYDVKNAFRLALYHSESTTFGGVLGYYRSFGKKITQSRLDSVFGTVLRAARLDSSFARKGVTPQPGTRLSLQMVIGHDDRYFPWEPWEYSFAALSATYALTILDTRELFQQFTVSGGVGHSFLITPGHSVALELRAAATFGDLKVPSQALFIGGPDGLRGYLPDELPGRAYAMARGEYRHLLAHDLNLNLLYFAYLRGIAGAAFVEAAAIVPCDATFFSGIQDAKDPAHDLVHNLFVDAGYSFQLIGDWLGVSQTRFNVEIAVPLIRRARSCFPLPDEKPIDPASRFPVGLFVYFGAPW